MTTKGFSDKTVADGRDAQQPPERGFKAWPGSDETPSRTETGRMGGGDNGGWEGTCPRCGGGFDGGLPNHLRHHCEAGSA